MSTVNLLSRPKSRRCKNMKIEAAVKYPIRLDDSHCYWLDDKPVPGFSQIVRELGIVKDNPFWTEDGREEGKAIHLWLHHLARGKTFFSPPDPRIAGRVEGIKKFLQDTKFKLAFGEMPQYDPVSRFATTPDLVGNIGLFTVNIDAKRGSPQKWHVLQLAAQRIALIAGGFRPQKSFGLYLGEEAYRLVEQDVVKHEPRWRNIAAVYHIAKEYR